MAFSGYLAWPRALTFLTCCTLSTASVAKKVRVDAEDFRRHGRLGRADQRLAAELVHVHRQPLVDVLDRLALGKTVAADDGRGVDLHADEVAERTSWPDRRSPSRPESP